ncbi:hypothetical protein SDC9_63390 [bioreactor metagenome]|uniref:Uncharacterized protein n=1 Tax=bioreactor metagenome TaxID=1076179 RepID=A0A644XML5_9ZZZZ
MNILYRKIVFANKIAIERLNKIVFARDDKTVVARIKRKVNIQTDMATLQERLAESLKELQKFRVLINLFLDFCLWLYMTPGSSWIHSR